MSKPKPKTAAMPAPQTVEELEAAIAELHAHRATIANVAAALDTHITALTETATRSVKTIEDEIARLTASIQAFCEVNRHQLTNGGRTKSHKFKTGTVAWRKGKSRVVITGDEDDVITSLKAMRFKRFIRIVEEIDKAEMLKQPHQAKTVPGVSIVDGVETFSIEA